MRAKFAFLVAAMALVIAALAPAASAETLRLFDVHEEELPDESKVNGLSTDFVGEINGGNKFHCDEFEWNAALTNVEDNVELNQIGTSELRGCHYTKYGPSGEIYEEYPWSFSNFEMGPLLLEPDGSIENFRLSYSNDPWACVFETWGTALSFTPSGPAQLNVQAFSYCLPYASITQNLTFSLPLYDEMGDPAEVRVF